MAARRNRWLYGHISILKKSCCVSIKKHKCPRVCCRLCVEGALDVAAQRVSGHKFSSDSLRSTYKSSSSRALQFFGVSITCRLTLQLGGRHTLETVNWHARLHQRHI